MASRHASWPIFLIMRLGGENDFVGTGKPAGNPGVARQQYIAALPRR